ncbi:MAG: hypothetical protein RL045_552 [Bacteroidota bacterium]|jgi:hypothetical protein
MLEASTLFLLILWRMEFNKLQHVPSVIEIKQVAEQLKGVPTTKSLIYPQAFVASRKFCKTNGAIYIPPFDDFDIIAGQATVTLEIL